jgi:hypothetical protein
MCGGHGSIANFREVDSLRKTTPTDERCDEIQTV